MSRDTIGDFLTVIRNGIMRSKPAVDIPFSQLKLNVAELLKNLTFQDRLLERVQHIELVFRTMPNCFLQSFLISVYDRLSIELSKFLNLRALSASLDE